MTRFLRFTLLMLGILALGWSYPATTNSNLAVHLPERPDDLSGAAAICDPDGTQTSGAKYRICMPSGVWNGDLVVYAHGYVSPTRPTGIPEDQLSLPGGMSIIDIATSLGYAFATTGYSTNGLAILEGVADLVELVALFEAAKGEPGRVYLVGVSEGGLITTLAVERHPAVFDGGLALCGPSSDFGGQINYFGDFRVLFDYFFPGLMPPSPVDIPASLIASWETSYYTATIKPALDNPANSHQVEQLLQTAQAPYDPLVPTTKEQTVAGVLWYNVFATNDAKAKLGGQPFDNQQRLYAGSDDDTRLNQQVQRFSADQAALNAIAAGYQSSGKLTVPLVMMHTTGDPIVPYEQAVQYRGKTIAADNLALHELITSDRYGHCNFQSFEVFNAFNRLVTLVNDPPPPQPAQRLFLPVVLR